MKIIIALLIAVIICGCGNRNESVVGSVIKETDKTCEKKFFPHDGERQVYYTTEEIDGCEYIVVSGRSAYGYQWKNIVHKGNCKYCNKK